MFGLVHSWLVIASVKARVAFYLPLFFRRFRSARFRRCFHRQWCANGVIVSVNDDTIILMILSPFVRPYQIFFFSLPCFSYVRLSLLYCDLFLCDSFGRLCWLHWGTWSFYWVCMLVWWVHGVFLHCFVFGLSVYGFCFPSGILVSECVLSFSSVSLMPASFKSVKSPVYVCSVDVLSCTVCTGVRVRFPRLVSVLVYCPVYVWTELDWKSGGTAPPCWGPAIQLTHEKKTEQG